MQTELERLQVRMALAVLDGNHRETNRLLDEIRAYKQNLDDICARLFGVNVSEDGQMPTLESCE